MVHLVHLTWHKKSAGFSAASLSFFFGDLLCVACDHLLQIFVEPVSCPLEVPNPPNLSPFFGGKWRLTNKLRCATFPSLAHGCLETPSTHVSWKSMVYYQRGSRTFVVANRVSTEILSMLLKHVLTCILLVIPWLPHVPTSVATSNSCLMSCQATGCPFLRWSSREKQPLLTAQFPEQDVLAKITRQRAEPFNIKYLQFLGSQFMNRSNIESGFWNSRN